MSALALIWMASIMGAGLFFLAGYLVKGPAQVAEQPAVPQPTLESAAHQGALQSAQAKLENTNAVLQDTSAELQSANTQLQSMGAEIAQYRAHHSELDETLGGAKAKIASLELVARRVSKLESELVTARAQAAETGRQLQVERSSPVDTTPQQELQVALARVGELESAAERAETLQRDLDYLQAHVKRQEANAQQHLTELEQDNTELQRALVGLEAQAEPLRSAAAERDSLRLDIEALSSRVNKGDDILRDNDRLRGLGGANARLEVQLSEAEQKIRDFEALGLIRVPNSMGHIPEQADTLEAAVWPLASQKNARTTVVADHLGLPIVGYGEHQEALAALCGLLVELDRNAQRLLPLTNITGITLQADHGAAVSVCRWRHTDDTLTLATLTAGPGPDAGRLESVLGQVARTLMLVPETTTERTKS